MRTAPLSTLMLLACTLPVVAQDKAGPNTLTPQEIADGWILLFDGETTFGWSADGNVKLEEGFLRLHGAKDKPARVTWDSRLPEEFEISAEATNAGHLLRERTLETGEIDLGISSFPSGKAEVGRGAFRLVYTLEGKLRKQEFYAPAEPRPIVSSHARQGRLTRLSFAAPNAAEIRTIKLRPLNTRALFNGKDLTGWQIFPGKKSQFTVEDGAIVCRNGPGDLQTEGKYADFVLQLECKSNGKHLNSGVFFRCKPNEYQNGYEAQIHNNFTADPPKQYTVEEYDPKTHKLAGKNKVPSAAVDFGTGAIYRRVPARKDVARDGEWFTMTIVAHGNHMATWVNGMQQVDWYDHRPASDNPRTGCRLEAGHISIQGHDPTTNLSFRNIRIAELPAK